MSEPLVADGSGQDAGKTVTRFQTVSITFGTDTGCLFQSDLERRRSGVTGGGKADRTVATVWSSMATMRMKMGGFEGASETDCVNTTTGSGKSDNAITMAPDRSCGAD
ncbi:MAG: hypothetical protein ABI216_03025 [Devosia sp.]